MFLCRRLGKFGEKTAVRHDQAEYQEESTVRVGKRCRPSSFILQKQPQYTPIHNFSPIQGITKRKPIPPKHTDQSGIEVILLYGITLPLPALALHPLAHALQPLRNIQTKILFKIRTQCRKHNQQHPERNGSVEHNPKTLKIRLLRRSAHNLYNLWRDPRHSGEVARRDASEESW
jgi:hypothetical protein